MHFWGMLIAKSSLKLKVMSLTCERCWSLWKQAVQVLRTLLQALQMKRTVCRKLVFFSWNALLQYLSRTAIQISCSLDPFCFDYCFFFFLSIDLFVFTKLCFGFWWGLLNRFKVRVIWSFNTVVWVACFTVLRRTNAGELEWIWIFPS